MMQGSSSSSSSLAAFSRLLNDLKLFAVKTVKQS
jgi:mevalonate pyrophosphate decarboxylase